MQHLRWSDIKDMNGVQMVSIIQHKTKRPVTVPLNTLALSLLPPRPENGENGIIFPLVKKPDNVAGRDRKGLHLSQQPTFGGNAGDNGRCGTLLGQQDIGAWQHHVHAGLRKGEHGEESGGNEPDGRDVLMKNGKSEQRERGPSYPFPLFVLRHGRLPPLAEKRAGLALTVSGSRQARHISRLPDGGKHIPPWLSKSF